MAAKVYLCPDCPGLEPMTIAESHQHSRETHPGRLKVTSVNDSPESRAAYDRTAAQMRADLGLS